MMKEIPQISEGEYEVMKVVWNYEPISTPEIVERVLKNSDWKPNTIHTMLVRLVKKKYYKQEKMAEHLFIHHLLKRTNMWNRKVNLS